MQFLSLLLIAFPIIFTGVSHANTLDEANYTSQNDENIYATDSEQILKEAPSNDTASKYPQPSLIDNTKVETSENKNGYEDEYDEEDEYDDEYEEEEEEILD